MGISTHDRVLTSAHDRRMLINEFQGQASVAIEAEPDDVFATITAIDRLPEWNARITAVLEPPADPSLPTGTEWVVQMTVPPARWPSRSRVVTFDPALCSFEHVSRSDDGNPSDVVWRWTVSPDLHGTMVTVEWDVYVRTFWRRLLFARLRSLTTRHLRDPTRTLRTCGCVDGSDAPERRHVNGR